MTRACSHTGMLHRTLVCCLVGLLLAISVSVATSASLGSAAAARGDDSLVDTNAQLHAKDSTSDVDIRRPDVDGALVETEARVEAFALSSASPCSLDDSTGGQFTATYLNTPNKTCCGSVFHSHHLLAVLLRSCTASDSAHALAHIYPSFVYCRGLLCPFPYGICCASQHCCPPGTQCFNAHDGQPQACVKAVWLVVVEAPALFVLIPTFCGELLSISRLCRLPPRRMYVDTTHLCGFESILMVHLLCARRSRSGLFRTQGLQPL